MPHHEKKKKREITYFSINVILLNIFKSWCECVYIFKALKQLCYSSHQRCIVHAYGTKSLIH